MGPKEEMTTSMRYAATFFAGPAIVVGCCLVLPGCGRAPRDPPAAAPISVKVSYPVEGEVTDHAEFTARTAAVDCVEVRAHVWGYLEKVHFKEGSLVKKGDLLFELDPRPYEAECARSLAALASAKAHESRTLADFTRAEELRPKNAISQSDYDLAKDDHDVAVATVKVAEAAVNIAKLNLSFTRITAPIHGRVSRYNVTVGNLVQSGEQSAPTLLTNIVSVDPMYVYFDVDERTVPSLRQFLRQCDGRSGSEGGIPVMLSLANEDGFRHRGTIDFIDNQVNPKTGTLRARASFPNKDESLLPGLFGRVRVPVGAARRALMVTDRAIDSDQGQKILYVVNDKKEVVSCRIRTGALHRGLRVIEDGLKPGQRVVVNGLQTVRSGMTVEPTPVDMPGQDRKSGDRGPGPMQASMSP
jgi:RND family efflux transporter MFP subunit